MMDKLEMIKALSLNRPSYAKNYDDYKEGDFVQYSGQLWDENEMFAAIDTLVNGKWITSGEKVAQFQNKFSKKFSVKNSHMVNSGSSANLVMITALKHFFNWQTDDEIIVSPVGFPTTIAPIVQNGLKAVFIDIELDTLNFDLTKIEEKITPRTKGIFVSPVLGNPPDMDVLRDICTKHGILLIGDNCDSLGSNYNGKMLTDYYFCWSTSFYPAHHISTGEGGMISTNDSELYQLMRMKRSHGMAREASPEIYKKYQEEYPDIIPTFLFVTDGYNFRNNEISAVLGMQQLKKLDKIIDVRNKNYSRYHKIINQYSDLFIIPNKL